MKLLLEQVCRIRGRGPFTLALSVPKLHIAVID